MAKSLRPRATWLACFIAQMRSAVCLGLRGRLFLGIATALRADALVKKCGHLAICLFLGLGSLVGCTPSPYHAYPQYEGFSRQTPRGLFLRGSTALRIHPQYWHRAREIRTVGVLPPDAKVYSLTAAETRDVVDQWSATARKSLLKSVADQPTTQGGLVIRQFDPTTYPASQQEYEDVRPLFEAVALSVWAHSYEHYKAGGVQPLKEGYIEYSLGPLLPLAEGAGTDALLFLYATDHISTGGRIGRQVLQDVISVLTLGAVPAPAIERNENRGQAPLATALVDPQTGDILWFYTLSGGGMTDLRDSTSTDRLVARAFEDLRKSAASWGEKKK